MIRLPNCFDGKNITFEIKFEKNIDITPLYPEPGHIPKDILRQLSSVINCYVTYSNMKSDINESRYICYNEIIIKIPILYKKRKFFFPIVSYVSDIYALIRGFYLGFYKENEFFIADSKYRFQFKNSTETVIIDIHR